MIWFLATVGFSAAVVFVQDRRIEALTLLAVLACWTAFCQDYF